MAHFVCPEHGEVEEVSCDGYSLGHWTDRDGPNELDLEGITFTFTVVENNKNNLQLDLVDADGARSYLSKFADWEQQVTDAAEAAPEYTCGKDECNKLVRTEP